jgi:hypothetical protein
VTDPTSLHADLEMIWAADTSVDPSSWTPERPSSGHCAVTALLVAQYTKATTIMRVVMGDGQSHYYNRLPDGEDVDLTRDQFNDFSPVGQPEVRTREYLLSNDDTRSRYELLRRRLGGLWSE